MDKNDWEVTLFLLLVFLFGVLIGAGASTSYHKNFIPTPVKAWSIYVEAEEREFTRHAEAVGR